MKAEQSFMSAIDIQYSYGLAKHMEQYRSNEALGYRTAGSKAEYLTGEMLYQEMKAIGLSQVCKDKISLDTWEFEKAVMLYTDLEGRSYEFQLGAYQTEFDTAGFLEFPLVYAGKGTKETYDELDVTGKLVIVEINQRDEWWINFPVYQAHLKGAAALIAVQTRGYGEIHSTALNAQDISGPEDAPAFSMSQADAEVLIRDLMTKDEITVLFDAKSKVSHNGHSYNITGKIQGRTEDQMILITAHYDSYFSGFQDDNAAVAMMLGIARSLKLCHYRPEKTLIFCAMAAEEWGMINSRYDWSVGAYEQIFHVHPEWRGKVIADLNFELPAYAHGSCDAIRCTYEYADFLTGFLEGLTVDSNAYPDGITVRYPIETWSDDFSMAIAGIPSMVNDFSSGTFMETNYHSQYDDGESFDEPVYLFHHQLYGRLLMAFDVLAVPPMDFTLLFFSLKESLNSRLCAETSARGPALIQRLEEASRIGFQLYERITAVNLEHQRLLKEGSQKEADQLRISCRELTSRLMELFLLEQDSFVRLTWHDEVIFPHEAVQNNLAWLNQAGKCLKKGEIQAALDAIYGIDNNRYAFLFEEEVFRYFTDYVLCQPKERLLWGAGRIVHHEYLFELVQSLKTKEQNQDYHTELEYQMIKKVEERQREYYRDDIEYIIHATEKMISIMLKSLELNLSFYLPK